MKIGIEQISQLTENIYGYVLKDEHNENILFAISRVFEDEYVDSETIENIIKYLSNRNYFTKDASFFDKRIGTVSNLVSAIKEYIKIKDNIVKLTCKEYDLTYKQLGEAIGYGEDAVKKAASTGTISIPMQKAIELYLENISLNNKLQDFKFLLKIIKKNS